MRVGWLGLGAMGAPMAACLAAAGHAVAAYDIVPGRAAALAADGVQAADSIPGAVRDAELVAIMVATAGSGGPGALRVGRRGRSPGGRGRRGDHGHGRARGRRGGRRPSGSGGVTVVDAPVSGGVSAPPRAIC